MTQKLGLYGADIIGYLVGYARFADKRDTEHLVRRVLSPEPRAG
jgi:hypothetical protein